MKTHLVPRSSLLAALAAAVLAGCGGHGQDGASTTAPRIKTQPQSTTAALGETATFTVSASTSGSGGLTYQWYKGSSLVSGATSATLTIPSVTNADYGSYTVRVSNELTTTTSGIATLSVPDTGAPHITTQPLSVTVTAGNPATFTVVATGDDLSYQWYFNGNAIDGATNASYTIATAGSSNSGTYTVRVTNDNGFVTSNGATLSLVSSTAPVITTQPAANPQVNQGATYRFSVVASGQAPLSYQWYKNGAPITGATGATYTISPVLAGDAGTYTVVVSNSLGSVTSTNSTLTVLSPPSIVSQPTSVTVNVNSSFTLSVTASGSNLQYQWYKNATAISGATSSSYTAIATTNSGGSYYVVVSNSVGSVRSSTVTVTVVGPPTITAQPTSATVGVGATATFTVTATTTAGSLTYQWYKNGSVIDGATGASYTTPATVAGDNNATYYVLVTNQAGTTQSSTVTLTVLQPPTITSQPQNLTVTVGQSASFTVVATSSLTPTYQWYKNGVAITGATAATYTIAAAATTDAGSYYVIVSNGGVTTASVTSTTATLTVNP